MIEKKHIKIPRITVQSLFNYLSSLYNRDGFDIDFSLLIIKNIKEIEHHVNYINDGILKPDSDETYLKYKEELNNLHLRYADRDDQGNIIYGDSENEPLITEMVVEWNNEVNLLNDKYKDILVKYENYENNNEKFLEEKIVIEISVTDDLYSLPKEVAPFYINSLYLND